MTLRYRPVAFYDIAKVDADHVDELSGCSPSASLVGPAGTQSVPLPDGEPAGLFTGENALEVPSRSWFSLGNTGRLTIEAWIYPSTTSFRHTESSGYVNWLGKGADNADEYELRMYSANNQEDRGNRISGYAFNPNGGLGSGSYFQDVIEPRQWLFVTVVFTSERSGSYPANTVTIFRDGVPRMTRPLSQFHVQPRSGDAPLRIGSMSGDSYFEGAITKVAVFDDALTPAQISTQARTMLSAGR